MTAKEYAAQQMDAKLKKLSKDGVLPKAEDRKSDEYEVNKKFFLAAASGRQEHIDQANEVIAKEYEAKHIEWREDGELKQKAQTVGTSTQGGLLVPVTLRNSIIERMRYISPMRQIATVIEDMPAILDMPVENALPTTYWVGEGVAITERHDPHQETTSSLQARRSRQLH